MIPEIDNDITVSSAENTKKVEYVADENTSYVYGLTYGGFKEDIVVSEYTGQTEYNFTIYTKGLALAENDGSYFLKDEDDVVKATIGDIIIFTADEKNNSTGNMSYVTVEENEEYLVTIHLDDEYLQDENTAYPIRIDPTIEVNYSNNGSGAIEDVTINSNGSSDGSSGSLYIGKRSQYGISRVLMRFPTLDTLLANKVHSSSNVIEANVEMRDLMCETEVMPINCHIFEGNSWNESSVSWNNVNADKYSMTLCTKNISYNIGINQEYYHWYNFDITKAVKTWVDGSFPFQKGIIFKTRNSIENGNNYIHKTFASYNRTSYKPSLTIRFVYSVIRNQFFSRYDPDKFNSNDTQFQPHDTTYLIRYRMNCYGYALCNIFNDCVSTPDGIMEGYKQQPGEFASNPSYILDNMALNDPTTQLQHIEHNLQLDANRLGYSISPYTLTSSTLPQFGNDSRLIAVATSSNGCLFHFYMQHSDGTWSHKPGGLNISNKVINDSSTTLTNENIYFYANSGSYQSGLLKFFTVTKAAVIDCPHSGHDYNYYPYIGQPLDIDIMQIIPPVNHNVDCKIIAGDYCETAVDLFDTYEEGRMDFLNDCDVFCYVPTNNLNCTIYATTVNNTPSNYNYLNLNVTVYNSDGNVVNPISGQQYQLSVAAKYYIKVSTTYEKILYYKLLIS